MNREHAMKRLVLFFPLVALVSCASPEGPALAPTPDGTGARVRFDVYAKPLPEIPLPNDFATRYDATSPTLRRINASMLAPTDWEKGTRAEIDQLDGWGTYQAVTVSFDKPLDVHNIIKRHQGDDYASKDDAVYLVDISPDSPDFCQRVPLDMGQGNFPVVLERPDYFENDRPGDNLMFEDREEDLNGNGQLDPGEDLDMDGVLDHPNTVFPNASGFKVMTFYERETNTLLMKPIVPLRENTTYAAVLTRRLVDEDGRPVRSPFDGVNHAGQTKALQPLLTCLPKLGLTVPDLAFTWSYTTQSITRDFKAVRDGLYGLGTLARLGKDFPVDIKQLPLREAQPGQSVAVRIIPGDEFIKVAADILQALNGGKLDPAQQRILESHKAIAYHAVFTFESPQFFPRFDADGKFLPLYQQTWKLDPMTGEAFVRPETVTVWVTVPKLRDIGRPAPVAILGHGYTGTKFDPLYYGGYFAQFGIASIGMENVSHGLGLPPSDLAIARGIFEGKGYLGLYKALIESSRSFDQNGDGIRDSGADFWTSYIVHTRDVVRQSAVDYMQLVRILKTFDGTRTWDYDNNKDGHPDLAGDFDGDGVVDIGGSGSISMTGGSLGGIMSTLMAGLEPQLDVAVPVSGGAGLLDIGIRSIQGGVREAVNLRMLGPLLVSKATGQGGAMELWEILPNLNSVGRVKLGPIGATLTAGDTVIVTNHKTNEWRCGRVDAGGLFRVAVPSDQGDVLSIAVYAGPLPPQPREGCWVPAGATPTWSAETVAEAFSFQAHDHAAGEPITALGDGFGIRRQSPEFRRFTGLGQLALDKGDPVNFVPFAEQRRLLKYGTGETVATRMLVVNTNGDMNVPVATGVAIARAAGMIDYTTIDPRYGKTDNQELIDTGVVEAVERVGRYRNAAGQYVHMDVENLSSISGTNDGFDVPRLSPPLRLVKPSDRIGGVTGVLFPLVIPTGKHGFDTPDPSLAFDLGSFMLSMMGRYFVTKGLELPMEPCNVTMSCRWVPPLP